MSRKRIIRIVSLLMLLAMVVFVGCALSNPALGSTVRIGPLEVDATHWRTLYAAYAVIAVGLFAASFFVEG